MVSKQEVTALLREAVDQNRDHKQLVKDFNESGFAWKEFQELVNNLVDIAVRMRTLGIPPSMLMRATIGASLELGIRIAQNTDIGKLP